MELLTAKNAKSIVVKAPQETQRTQRVSNNDLTLRSAVKID